MFKLIIKQKQYNLLKKSKIFQFCINSQILERIFINLNNNDTNLWQIKIYREFSLNIEMFFPSDAAITLPSRSVL